MRHHHGRFVFVISFCIMFTDVQETVLVILRGMETSQKREKKCKTRTGRKY